MSKKIVIIPTFCESHLIKCQIPNLIDTIAPDIIIYNEGMFPNGTEGNKKITQQWLDKYTLGGEGKRGFDYLELKQIIQEAQQLYPDTQIILNEVEYKAGMTSTECYVHSTTNFKELGIDIQSGDFLFPLEGDVFHHEDSKDEIAYYLTQLEPDTGFRSRWIDFVENQFYVEKQVYTPKCRSRRIGIKFHTWEFYLKVLNQFMHEFSYDMLYPTDLITYHYAWWRPNKFRDLRFDQLQRDSYYWEYYKRGLDLANLGTEREIKIRYNRDDSDACAYITFTREFNHPKHVSEHECWKDSIKFDNL